MSSEYAHLVHICSHDELALYDLIPDVVWVFDLDKHGWWWGNAAAVKFWGLNSLQELIDKDLSGDTQGARERTVQTFELAAKNGLTIDPWTTYPNGKPKTLFMRHRACLLGPEKHRGIIAYINEEVNLGDTPENLLLVEAMRYTSVMVTSFTFSGDVIVENPAATEAYKHLQHSATAAEDSPFSLRFADPAEGRACLEQAVAEKGGRWTYPMRTTQGERRHTLDIRMTRHPLSGEFLILMAEYDVTELHQALDKAEQVQGELRRMAHYDALTGLPTLYFLLESAPMFMASAERNREQVAVLFIDLDGFKTVNDSWGHSVGDRVLIEAAARINGVMRRSDQAARIGGDEFVAMLAGIHQPEDAAEVAQKLISSLEQPILIECEERGRIEARISASIGIAFCPQHGGDLEQLIKVADAAMYQVKHQGKGSFTFAP
ncbi:GGDEF domain-containing protein [Neptuniibacter halophilus]|uniref:GGDEF domain-containing protein n=1 Tax=Neptuniibacter halophilus TaxID=651666 RepID=UPI0025743C35|nr:GGDEF domain-containing protein [Neptuniibacter halophilus]